MGVAGQSHAQDNLLTRRRLATPCAGCWVGPRVHLDECGKSQSLWDLIPRPSSTERVAILTTLSQPTFVRCGIQVVSQLVDITTGGDFLGLCDQKSSYKHVSDFGWLRSYGHFLIPVRALV